MFEEGAVVPAGHQRHARNQLGEKGNVLERIQHLSQYKAGFVLCYAVVQSDAVEQLPAGHILLHNHEGVVAALQAAAQQAA